jgi:hypothetical protein
VQRLVLAEGLALDALTPARLVEMSGLKTPVLLYQRDDARVAVEVELTVKSRQQIYIGFTDHLRAIGAGQYQTVRYLFAREAMAQLCRGLLPLRRPPNSRLAVRPGS